MFETRSTKRGLRTGSPFLSVIFLRGVESFGAPLTFCWSQNNSSLYTKRNKSFGPSLKMDPPKNNTSPLVKEVPSHNYLVVNG